jgi:hypothetical protein
MCLHWEHARTLSNPFSGMNVNIPKTLYTRAGAERLTFSFSLGVIAQSLGSMASANCCFVRVAYNCVDNGLSIACTLPRETLTDNVGSR